MPTTTDGKTRTRKKLVWTVSAIAFAVLVTSCATPYTPPTGGGGAVVPTGAARNGNWSKLIFRDDFDNGTGKWQRNWRMGNDTSVSPPANKSWEAACWNPANTFTRNGELVMRAESKPCTDAFGRTYASTTGGASTGSWNFTYGYVEARIFLPADGSGKIANFPAFWVNGVPNDSGAWPRGGEIDVIEGLESHVSCWHYHWGSGQAAGGCPPVSPVAGWHTYGVAWEPGSLKFYYDGNLVATHTSGVVSNPMYIALDNAVPSTWARTLPAEMRVDYVRVWQH